MLSRTLGISVRCATVYVGCSHAILGICKANSEFVVRMVVMPIVLAGQISVSRLSPTIMQSFEMYPACFRARSKILVSGFFSFLVHDIAFTLINFQYQIFRSAERCLLIGWLLFPFHNI